MNAYSIARNLCDYKNEQWFCYTVLVLHRWMSGCGLPLFNKIFIFLKRSTIRVDTLRTDIKSESCNYALFWQHREVFHEDTAEHGCAE